MPKPTPWTACTAQRRDGAFCDRSTLPDAPFPICVVHAAQLYGFLHGTVHDRFQHLDVDIGAVQAQLYLNGVNFADRMDDTPDNHIVYYVRVGELIKVGTTTSLRNRLQAYPPGMTTLLATEPGGVEVERARLDQFRHLRHSGREWFTPGPSLIEHMNSLRQTAHDEPLAS